MTHCLQNNAYVYLPRKDTDEILRFRDGLRGLYPVRESDNNSLVLFIRSGDVTRCDATGSNRWYWQPPVGFYLEVMRLRNWSSVELVSKDLKSPGVEQLIAAGANWTRRSVWDDVGVLLGARNLAIGTGTFGIAASWLAKDLQHLWTYANPSARFPNVHENCVPTAQYQERLVARGHACDEEERMLTANASAKCLRWEIIPHDSTAKQQMWREFG